MAKQHSRCWTWNRALHSGPPLSKAPLARSSGATKAAPPESRSTPSPPWSPAAARPPCTTKLSKEISISNTTERWWMGLSRKKSRELAGIHPTRPPVARVERVRRYEKAQVDGKLHLPTAQAMALVLGVKEPAFTEADVPALLQLSGAAVGRIQETWQRLSGLKDDDLLVARKNSSTTPSAAGSTS